MIDTNKLFDRYLAKDTCTRELVFVRLYGRMEKELHFNEGAALFFNELENILEMVENTKENTKEVNEE